MIFGITITIYTIAYNWTQLQVRIIDKHKSLWHFIPIGMIYYLIMFNLKTFAGVIYLKKFNNDAINKSKSTGRLFWFRFLFDLLAFLDILFINRYLVKDNEPDDRKTVYFKAFFVILPLALSWVIIYRISVVPAKKRVAYKSLLSEQKLQRIKKLETDPEKPKVDWKEKLEFYNKKKYEYEYEYNFNDPRDEVEYARGNTH